MSNNEVIGPGCRYISGDPHEILTRGEDIYCNRPISRQDRPWCAGHMLLIYPPAMELSAIPGEISGSELGNPPERKAA